MYIFAFIVVLCATILINNKVKSISSDNNESYEFDKTSIIVISSLFLLGILLNFIMKNFQDHYFLVLAIYSGASLAGIMIANQLKMQRIEKRREDIDEIYDILDKILRTNPEDIDYNNVPFEIEYDKEDSSRIASVTLEISNPDRFNDANLTDAIYRMNEYLNYFQWLREVDFPKRKCKFIGQKKPPTMAPFPGSDLRAWNWIPLGVGSNGEIAWNLGANDEDLGSSLFRFPDTGELAGTTDIAKAPQCLTLGSTGGGKAISIDEKVKTY